MALRAPLRVFRSRPGITVAIVLSVGVATGALAATFSLVDAVLLAPLPFADSQALVLIAERDPRRPDERLALSPHTLRAIEETRDVLADQAAVQTITAPQVWTGGVAPRELRALAVTPTFFEVLGVTPAAGRTFGVEDPRAPSPPVVVSHRFWQDSLGADVRIVGSPILIGGQSHTVAGVAPRGFAFADATVDFWWPASLSGGSRARGLIVVGRLRSGVSAATAERRLEAALAAVDPRVGRRELGLRVASLADEAVRDVRQTLWLLLLACGLLLTMAWANAVVLRAMQAATRVGEVAVRGALGATHRQLRGQIAAESAALTLVIGLVGVIGAWITLRVAIAWLAADVTIPRVDTARLGLRSVAVIGGVLIATWAWLALPFWRRVPAATEADLLRRGASTLIAARQGIAWHGLVAAQFCVAFIELAGAVLLVRTAAQIARVDVGFRPEQVVTLRVVLSPGTSNAAALHPRRLELFNAMLEDFRRLPGVMAAGGVRGLPLAQPVGTRGGGYLRGAGHAFDMVPYRLPGGSSSGVEPPTAEYRVASAGYLAAMGIPFRQGRDFDERGGLGGPPVVAVSEEVVRRLGLPSNPVGQSIEFHWPGQQTRATIVAVVGDVRHKAIGERPLGAIYRPLTQMTFGNLTFALRTTADVDVVATEAVAIVRRIDPLAVVSDVRPMADVVAAAQGRQRLSAALLAALCATSLAVALLGVFSVVAFRVRAHLRELALRLALGANARQIVLLVMWRSVAAAVIGILLGLGAVAASTPVLQSLVHDTGRMQLPTLFASALALIAIGLVAAYLPARRARAIDPGISLRAE